MLCICTFTGAERVFPIHQAYIHIRHIYIYIYIYVEAFGKSDSIYFVPTH